jgi:hypothetical protein
LDWEGLYWEGLCHIFAGYSAQILNSFAPNFGALNIPKTFLSALEQTVVPNINCAGHCPVATVIGPNTAILLSVMEILQVVLIKFDGLVDFQMNVFFRMWQQ